MEEKGTETVGSMFKKMKYKPLKISLIVILSVIMIFSCCSMALYYFLPVIEKNITYGLSTDKNGNPYIDVEYWSNKEGNGVELLDIRLHGYATIEDFQKNDSIMYYKGIQFVGNEYGSIDFNFNHENISNFWGQLAFVFAFQPNDVKAYYMPTDNVYYYDSQNNVSFKSIENLNEDYRFKVSLGSGEDAELYFMKLMGLSDKYEDDDYNGRNHHVHNVYDIMYLSKSLLNSIRANNKGMNAEGSITMDVGLMFDYMKYSAKASDQKWMSVSEASDDSKIKTHIQEFAMVNFVVHSDGAKQASDSMFGIIADSSDFEYTNPNIKDNYLFGQQAVNLTEKHFTLVDGKLDFTTKTKTFLRLNQYVNMIIEVDNDVLKAQRITYTGFADDVKAYKDRIISFVVKNTQNGQTIYSEVVL